VSKSTKCPHVSGEEISRPQREADEDSIADDLCMERSEEFPEAKDATDGDLLSGGVELALAVGDCRWLTDSDFKLLRREAFLEECLAFDMLFIIIPGMVIGVLSG
jgi:hypothetical protein